MFDILTDFSVELVYILYLHFEKISIVKPFSSRSANSERYIICMNLQTPNPVDLISYLTSIAKKLNDLKPLSKAPKSGHQAHQPGFSSKQEKVELGLLDLVHIISIDAIMKDELFSDAINGSNMK